MELEMTNIKDAVSSGRKDIEGIIDFITEKANRKESVSAAPVASGVTQYYKLTTSEETCYKTHDSSGTIRFS
jgi:hypothetical protein